jgi:thiol-disulfide isomerase/thioredoxin
MKEQYVKFLRISLYILFVGLLSGCDNNAKSNRSTPYGKAAMKATLTGSAMDADGIVVSANLLLDTDYLLIYFSAHWCPPCRQFTPKLVNFYNSYGESRPFDLVFVSSDRSEKEMFAYMRETKMPWPAMQFKGAGASRLSKHYAGSGIPCLVLISPSGKVLADSYKGRPQSVLNYLKGKIGAPGAGSKKAASTKKKKSSRTKTISSGQFKLNAMGQKKGKHFAIINGKIYFVGSTISSGVIVTKITSSYVELSVDGEPLQIKQ